MRSVFSALMAYVVSRFRSHQSLRLENMALRHQLAVYQHTVKRPRAPASLIDSSGSGSPACGRAGIRLMGVRAASHRPCLAEEVLPRLLATPESEWHAGASRHIRNKVRGPHSGHVARKPEREAHRALWASSGSWVSAWPNPPWRSIRQKGTTKSSSPTWKAFLANHVTDIGACDFFTVPSATFRVLFVFLLLAHERRRIVHFNITEHPRAPWTAQQIVAACPWDTVPPPPDGIGTRSTVWPSNTGSRTWASKRSLKHRPAQSLAESVL